jgi:hypothetical protein
MIELTFDATAGTRWPRFLVAAWLRYALALKIPNRRMTACI